MKLYLILILIIVLDIFIGCNSAINSNDVQTKSFYSLTRSNLEYFKTEYPQNYSITPWYRKLLILDSVVDIEKNNKTISINSLNNIHNLITKKMIKSQIFDNHEQDSLLIYSCKTYADLLKLEYIVGNVIIKNYNYFLYRAPFTKVIIDKDYFNKTGKVYLAVYDPNNNNYVVINNDTIYSDGGILSIDIKKYKKNSTNVKGYYFYYKPVYGKYISMKFSL
jgi:hypothetical protein